MSFGSNEKLIETDVLVIGAGMAGFFAAIKAKAHGLDVTIADKSYSGKSGSTHFSEGDVVFFRPERGHNMKEWLDVISKSSEYINNREWDEICLRESRDTYDDLVSWGIQFYQKDGQPYVFSGIGKVKTPYQDVSMMNRTYAPALRKKAIDIGVRVMDRVVFNELIKQDGEIAGAVGINTTNGYIYIIKAKAVVMATGNSNLKSGSYPVDFWSGDGEAMAYKIGAQLANKEFAYGMGGYLRDDVKQQEQSTDKPGIQGKIYDQGYRYPFIIGGNWTGWYDQPSINAEGGPVKSPAWEAHNGRIPLYYDFDSYTPARWEWLREFFNRIGTFQGDKLGLDPFQGGKYKWPSSRIRTYSIHGGGGGIWVINTNCATDVPGLFAAGNSSATLASGASYGGMGFGSNHAAVTGTRAGNSAAEFALKKKNQNLDINEVNRIKKIICEPMDRKGGFSPAWVTQVLHGFTIPYYFLVVKHEDRMKLALGMVEHLRSHIIPQIKANNPHEWRMALETKNIAFCAEMRLRASLFRTESRGGHYREDYPRRDDPTWLAWVKIKNENGKPVVYKEQVPQKWWPDLSAPYEIRYPRAFPPE